MTTKVYAMEAEQGIIPRTASTSNGNGKKRVKLYLAEEQQMLREAFRAFFIDHGSIEVVGSSADTSAEALAAAAIALNPKVILMGIRVLQPAAVEKLEALREQCPGTAFVLLSASYDLKGLKSLREFARGTKVGCAYLLKHTIDTVDQLTQVIISAAEGRIIVDPAVMDGLMTTGEGQTALIKELSPREVEVLSWMAKGYRNNTIAEVLCLEPKTVERHINSIYSKLEPCPEAQHPRVHAVTLYMRATGLLPANPISD